MASTLLNLPNSQCAKKLHRKPEHPAEAWWAPSQPSVNFWLPALAVVVPCPECPARASRCPPWMAGTTPGGRNVPWAWLEVSGGSGETGILDGGVILDFIGFYMVLYGCTMLYIVLYAWRGMIMGYGWIYLPVSSNVAGQFPGEKMLGKSTN